jgi:hypothetical protein
MNDVDINREEGILHHQECNDFMPSNIGQSRLEVSHISGFRSGQHLCELAYQLPTCAINMMQDAPENPDT